MPSPFHTSFFFGPVRQGLLIAASLHTTRSRLCGAGDIVSINALLHLLDIVNCIERTDSKYRNVYYILSTAFVESHGHKLLPDRSNHTHH